ncbi:MAG TPA: hypothetical protein VK155_06835 [Bacteroidales bacterium]|nr:hypothetical protein [Bacteroidales bacterium]
MKKVFTILFIIVVLLSGLTVRYSAHFCQGNFIASRFSITGKNADCGMNRQKGESKDARFSNLMCVNEITTCTFSTDYVYTPQVDFGNKTIQHIDLPTEILSLINVIPATPEFRQLPPGSHGLVRAECEVLCVFLI